MWLKLLHDWLCQVLFGGDWPAWLEWLHQFFT